MYLKLIKMIGPEESVLLRPLFTKLFPTINIRRPGHLAILHKVHLMPDTINLFLLIIKHPPIKLLLIGRKHKYFPQIGRTFNQPLQSPDHRIRLYEHPVTGIGVHQILAVCLDNL